VGPQVSAKLSLERLKKRADFLRAQKGRRHSTACVGLEICRSPDSIREGTARVGFTASKKVGNAVARNRAKRRLRAVAAAILPLSGRAAHDYVLIARTATVSRPFAELSRDLSKAIAAAHAALDRGVYGEPGNRGTRGGPA
jgi:ribonuclease P protein component